MQISDMLVESVVVPAGSENC